MSRGAFEETRTRRAAYYLMGQSSFVRGYLLVMPALVVYLVLGFVLLQMGVSEIHSMLIAFLAVMAWSIPVSRVQAEIDKIRDEWAGGR